MMNDDLYKYSIIHVKFIHRYNQSAVLSYIYIQCTLLLWSAAAVNLFTFLEKFKSKFKKNQNTNESFSLDLTCVRWYRRSESRRAVNSSLSLSLVLKLTILIIIVSCCCCCRADGFFYVKFNNICLRNLLMKVKKDS